ncbi:hypothetical protein BU198_35155 [Streptomyces sp. CBMA156]|nr:hypothetical protein [Streptomyces sp. CBMA156]MBD0675793.1 hypothetical protein [Streptomyces sp. CBMA156]
MHAGTCTWDNQIPNGLRMTNRLAGQELNHSADQVLADELSGLVDGVRAAVCDAVEFKVEVARAAVDRGIRQIVDLGCGVPQNPYLYRTVQSHDPDALVVSVEHDEWALAYARTSLDVSDRTPVIAASYLCADVLDHPDLRCRVTWERPVCALLVSAAHTAPLHDLAALVSDLVGRLPRGSVLAVSQWTLDDELLRGTVNDLLTERTRGRWGLVRSSAEITAALAPHPLLGPPSPVAGHAWPATGRVPAPAGGQRAALVEFGGIIHVGNPLLPVDHQDMP